MGQLSDAFIRVVSTVTTNHPGRAAAILERINRGLAAVEPEGAVARSLSTEPAPQGEVTVIAVGKAAAAMARGVRRAFPESRLRGIAVSDHTEPTPPGIELVVTAHPTPDESSVAAGRRLLELVDQTENEIIFLISGGGSALIEVPGEGLEIGDLTAATRVLLAGGVPINEMNTVRTHLSAIKGGRLGARANGPVTTVVISDVTNGPPHLVSSGPTVTCPTTPSDAISVLRRYGLDKKMPARIIETLTFAPLPPVVVGGRVIVAADGAAAAEAAAAGGGTIVSTSLGGPADSAAVEAIAETPPGSVGVFAGETTVELRGGGIGGRNQEAALAAAIAIDNTATMFAAVGTDGVDGPTDAAGALVDGDTASIIRNAGIDPAAALADNDSHTALDAAGALIRTGPTGTNVADLWVIDRQ